MLYDDLYINVFYNTLIFHLRTLFSIKRQFNLKPKLINPWGFVNSVNVSYDVAIKWLSVLNKSSNSFITWTAEKLKSGKVKSISVKFTHKGVLRYHVSKVLKTSKADVDKLFRREWGDGTNASIVCRESCPVILNFKLSSGKLSLSGSYELFSESGVLML